MAKLLNCGHFADRPVGTCPQCAAHAQEHRGTGWLKWSIAALAFLVLVAEARERGWLEQGFAMLRAERDRIVREEFRKYEHPTMQRKPGPVDMTGAPSNPDFAAGAAATPISLEKKGQLPRPSYPRKSEILGEQGVVKIRYCLGADGHVDRDMTVLSSSSGFARLDESALEHARTGAWDEFFVPAKDANGNPVGACVTVPFRFAIQP